jgi:hypothetical protein
MRLFPGAWVMPPRLGGRSSERATTLHRIPWHLPYNWGKLRKTSVRLTEGRLPDQRRTLFVQSTWPPRATASTGLLASAALGFRVRRRASNIRQAKPSLTKICRVASAVKMLWVEWSEIEVEEARKRFAVIEDGTLNRGRRCAIMLVFAHRALVHTMHPWWCVTRGTLPQMIRNTY